MIFISVSTLLLYSLFYPHTLSVSAASAQIGNTKVTVQWTTNYEDQSILFSVSLSDAHFNWISVGFSPEGKFNNSDLCVLKNGQLLDHFIDDEFRIRLDRSQDCELITATPLAFSFRRHFSTCDPRDYIFEPGTTQILIAGSMIDTDKFLDENVFKQFVYGKVISEKELDTQLEDDAFSFAITANELTVPSVTTTYWCIVQRIPMEIEKRKHHAIKMEALVQKGNEHLVHHMEIFHCQHDQLMPYEGDCSSEERPKESRSCSRVIAAWAMGEEPVLYPSMAGLPIGGIDTVPYIMVEIHYNNPQNIQDVRDNSGFQFTVTPSLRKYDAGIMELGLVYSDAMSIPPQQREFAMEGYCVRECTEKFPESGISIFGSQLHAHLTGRRIFTSHYRKGVKMGEINRDNHYSPHWQHIQPIWPPITVLPGDVLSTTCVYETLARKKVTLGGYGILDEMCVNYLYYYPLSEVEVCKSTVNNGSLHRFFDQKGVPRQKSISQKYNSIDWNRENVLDLQELYAASPLNMHCLGHDGSQLESASPRSPWSLTPRPRPFTGPFNKGISEEDCPSLNFL